MKAGIFTPERGDMNLIVVAAALPVIITLFVAAVDIARVPLAEQALQSALNHAASDTVPNWIRCSGNPVNCKYPYPKCPDNDKSAYCETTLENIEYGMEPFLPSPLIACQSAAATNASQTLGLNLAHNCEPLYEPRNWKLSALINGSPATSVTDMAGAISHSSILYAVSSLISDTSGLFKYDKEDVFFWSGIVASVWPLDSQNFSDYVVGEEFFPGKHEVDVFLQDEVKLDNWDSLLQSTFAKILKNFPGGIQQNKYQWYVEGPCYYNSGIDGCAGMQNTIPSVFLLQIGIIRLPSLFSSFGLKGIGKNGYVTKYNLTSLPNVAGVREDLWQ